MSNELIDRKQVQEMFSLTTKQFGRIMRNIERRHPLESWIKRIKENNKEKLYIKQECVEWLKEVYFNKEEHCLTLEIEFYKKRIFALEQELGIITQPKKYRNTLLRFLDIEFNKSRNVIQVAVHRMQKEFHYPIKYEVSGMIFVKAEGVKWLHENYFRRDYLKELEEYKWMLQNQKNNSNIKDTLRFI